MAAKIPGGYIIFPRRIIESEIWQKPPLYLKVWIYLLAKAQHMDYKNLKRGQLRTSIPEIQEACSWKVGFRKEKPTKDQIFQILDWMRKKGSSTASNDEADTKATTITTTKATHGIIVTIENYGFYQDPKNYESNSESNNEKVTGATPPPNNINKNDKNKKIKTTSPDGVGEEISNKALIAELTQEYRSIQGVKPRKGDYAFIGALYNEYGYGEVHTALNALRNKLSSGSVQDTFSYLRGILKQQSKITPFPRLPAASEPVRVNMPSAEEIERQKQVELEMMMVQKQIQARRKEVLKQHGT